MTEEIVFALYETVKREVMKNPFDCLFVRERHVCPWWLCFTFDNLIRKLLHNPENILAPYVHEGNTVLDIGPGMGYFSCLCVMEEPGEMRVALRRSFS